jgi:hypothetical protein
MWSRWRVAVVSVRSGSVSGAATNVTVATGLGATTTDVAPPHAASDALATRSNPTL